MQVWEEPGYVYVECCDRNMWWTDTVPVRMPDGLARACREGKGCATVIEVEAYRETN